jgi:hypothetical protein
LSNGVRLLDSADALRAFLDENKGKLKLKGQEKRTSDVLAAPNLVSLANFRRTSGVLFGSGIICTMIGP